jgi:hypothetical protein
MEWPDKMIADGMTIHNDCRGNDYKMIVDGMTTKWLLMEWICKATGDEMIRQNDMLTVQI